jgi:hypothetical protein
MDKKIYTKHGKVSYKEARMVSEIKKALCENPVLESRFKTCKSNDELQKMYNKYCAANEPNKKLYFEILEICDKNKGYIDSYMLCKLFKINKNKSYVILGDMKALGYIKKVRAGLYSKTEIESINKKCSESTPLPDYDYMTDKLDFIIEKLDRNALLLQEQIELLQAKNQPQEELLDPFNRAEVIEPEQEKKKNWILRTINKIKNGRIKI